MFNCQVCKRTFPKCTAVLKRFDVFGFELPSDNNVACPICWAPLIKRDKSYIHWTATKAEADQLQKQRDEDVAYLFKQLGGYDECVECPLGAYCITFDMNTI
jgi:hypothetical protein